MGPRGLTASHQEGLASCRQPRVSAADGPGRDDALEKRGRLRWLQGAERPRLGQFGGLSGSRNALSTRLGFSSMSWDGSR